ncbi:hypothetical protein [Nitrolancea hollandica]|uniref:hypothetical protein n=1 Tax=Nitrolancea hollandica TaxID=1206749 RepID=UPI00193092D3|nr:hypothetical protein [Nitrolancea hollandica]
MPTKRIFELDPVEMAQRGRIGAYVTHSRHDPRETTAKARETFLARFEREVDPEGVLPEAERLRRAEAARKAYFSRLAYQSAKARRARAAARKGGQGA